MSFVLYTLMYHYTVFLYFIHILPILAVDGQTGSGKTFTMEG